MNETAIHDLGYRRYEGEREGPRGAWMAIFTQGIRTMFGLGRSAKAKVVPVFVVVVTALQVIGALFASSVSQGALPVRYGNVLQGSVLLYLLFVAAQSPEIFSRDQQHRILPLVLTRASSRFAYVSARLGSVVASVFLIVFGSLFLLYIGEIGLAAEPTKRFGEMGDRFFPVLLVSVLTSMALGGLGAGISSWSPRRAFATASIIAVVLLATAVGEALSDLVGVASRSAQMLNLFESVRIFTMVMIGESNRGFETNPPLDNWVYIVQMLGYAAIGVALLQLRLRRLET